MREILLLLVELKTKFSKSHDWKLTKMSFKIT
jgi:hypothetical protein